MATNLCVQDLDFGHIQLDGRRLEVVVEERRSGGEGSSWPLATLVSSTEMGQRKRRAAAHKGAVLEAARQRKEPTN